MTWSPFGDRCGECGTSTRPHRSRGLCARCYGRLRYQGGLPPSRAGQSAPWSHYGDRCVECGTNDRPHKTRGLCGRCHGRLQYQGKLPPRTPRPLKPRPRARSWWSRWASKCIDCGRTDRRHGGYGYCQACYRRRRPVLEGISASGAPWGPGGIETCVDCGCTNHPHRGHGLCAACFMRAYYSSSTGKEIMRACALRYLSTPGGKLQKRESTRRRRDRKRDVGDVVPTGYERLVLDIFGRRCACCGSPGPVELDHHVPLSRGRGLLHNAVPLCVRCNRSKNACPPEQFYDAWKLTEIQVYLHEARVAFAERFGDWDPVRHT